MQPASRPARQALPMTKDPAEPSEAAPEHLGDTRQPPAGRSAGEIRQEQYQRTREQAIAEQEEQDREAGIRRRAHEIWLQEGQPEGLAEEHWERATQQIRREAEESRRNDPTGDTSGIGCSDHVRDKT